MTAKRIVVDTEKWDVLPSFNLTISPTRKQSIRLSGSRTVSRPEFREIAPFAFFDYELNYSVMVIPICKEEPSSMAISGMNYTRKVAKEFPSGHFINISTTPSN
ncbi:MAG: hypothetical protein HC867_02650 [Bacteroidia bacterium]|nr:hypothetical protein [Bacteroidia bacterium]